MATATKATPAQAKPAEPATAGTDAIVQIDRIGAETIRVPIVGVTPLIVCRFSEKAKRQMLDAMQGRRTPRTVKDPEAEFQGAIYRFPPTDEYPEGGGSGFPVIGFKAATVSAARFYGKAVTMVGLRQTIFFAGEMGVDGQMLARLAGDEPKMREDVVRVGNGGTDLRYRPEYRNWSTTIDVTYVSSMLSRQSVLSLIDAGGMGVGVGEWRPERKGDFGTFKIDESRKVEVIG